MYLQRKSERDFVTFGGLPPSPGPDAIESDEEHEDEEAIQQVASVSGIFTICYPLSCIAAREYVSVCM